ncbi:MAG: DUF4124 domain-containing protein [Gammaproteobacteria bacterium]|nr:DUF4124 domain-containing protein [Gammaproteobacteria bacterium]
MKWFPLIAITFVLFANNALAEIYKCVDSEGNRSFQDSPCPEETKEETVQIQTGSESPQREFSESLLVGKWCEYAVSLDVDGEKDTSRPATWHFKNKKEMSYTYKTKSKPKKEIFNKYSVKDNRININNPYIGNWDVESFRGLTLILAGPLGGYAHLRRGAC